MSEVSEVQLQGFELLMNGAGISSVMIEPSRQIPFQERIEEAQHHIFAAEHNCLRQTADLPRLLLPTVVANGKIEREHGMENQRILTTSKASRSRTNREEPAPGLMLRVRLDRPFDFRSASRPEQAEQKSPRDDWQSGSVNRLG